jgi:hypothetical protein
MEDKAFEAPKQQIIRVEKRTLPEHGCFKASYDIIFPFAITKH